MRKEIVAEMREMLRDFLPNMTDKDIEMFCLILLGTNAIKNDDIRDLIVGIFHYATMEVSAFLERGEVPSWANKETKVSPFKA